MVKIICTVFLVCFSTMAMAQQTREELEKQRAQLKKELEQTQRMVEENKAKSKESFLNWKLVNDKVNIQERIIDNINRDINLLDDNMVTTQRDINRYDKLLDTLKQEYAKSMIYAYKNRSNYDFINFVFSASSFNDAIKRVTYLKSYRNYREMQGENILRTQELRKKRIEELSGTKQKKSMVLQDKDKEMSALEIQQREKDRVLSELKKQGKQLNNQLAATRNQLKKVDNAITAAIARAINDAKKLAAKKAAEDKIKDDAVAKANAKANTNTNPTTSPTKPTIITKKADPKKAAPESVLLNAENKTINTEFINNRGALPWPVDKGYTLMHYGPNTLVSGTVLVKTGVTVAADIGSSVKSVFNGTVTTVANIDDMQVVIIQHGKYFSTYSNLTNVSVQRGQVVTTGQVIGRVAENLDGIGAIDFYISDEKANQDPERWLRHR
ncbi:murein hydrolase activator EnvC family protein [Ferruginibacter sp. SUN106]|uniref:murein hydrolase activator EnvC family protein n=1 Tax=Ferruginibacter sp. SUN106 TaxID=2978348 RepID=UPI003D364C33